MSDTGNPTNGTRGDGPIGVGGRIDDLDAITAAAEASLERSRKRVQLSQAENRTTAVLGVLVVFGLFLDGWNHINLQDNKLGAFLTPWHAVLYAGITASGAWVMTRNGKLDKIIGALKDYLRAVPLGYRLAVLGMVLIGIGAAGDAVWHTVFGIEQGVARVISPFHLWLFSGAMLVLTAPLRALWSSRRSPVAPTLRELAPALMSLSFVASVAAFILQFDSVFVLWSPIAAINDAASAGPLAAQTKEIVLIAGVSGVMITNLVLVAPILLLLRRWLPPAGAITLLVLPIATWMCALSQMAKGAGLIDVLAACIVADVLVQKLRVSPVRPEGAWIVAPAFSFVLWLGWMLTPGAGAIGNGWPLDVWLGTIVVSSLMSLGLATLVVAPPLPGRIVRTTEARHAASRTPAVAAAPPLPEQISSAVRRFEPAVKPGEPALRPLQLVPKPGSRQDGDEASSHDGTPTPAGAGPGDRDDSA